MTKKSKASKAKQAKAPATLEALIRDTYEETYPHDFFGIDTGPGDALAMLQVLDKAYVGYDDATKALLRGKARQFMSYIALLDIPPPPVIESRLIAFAEPRELGTEAALAIVRASLLKISGEVFRTDDEGGERYFGWLSQFALPYSSGDRDYIVTVDFSSAVTPLLTMIAQLVEYRDLMPEWLRLEGEAYDIPNPFGDEAG